MRKETIGNCELYLGDCLEVMPTLGKVDAVVTDPPYLIQTQGGGCFGSESRQYKKQIKEAGIDCGFDEKIITSEQFNSAIVFCHNDQLSTLIPHLAGQYDKYCVCFWHKENPMPVANKHYQPECEIYIHAWNHGYHPMGGLNDLKRVFALPVGKSQYDHPTVKPLPLMRKVIKNTNAETILDPFMGSGTTGVACVKLGRKFIGIELEPKYFDIACKRIEEAYKQPDFLIEPPIKHIQDKFI